MNLLKYVKHLIFGSQDISPHFSRGIINKGNKYLLSPIDSISIGPQTSKYTKSSMFDFLSDDVLNETLCCLPNKK